VEGFHPRSFDCEVGSHFHHRSRFRKPPSHPGRSDFPSPVGGSNFPWRTFPCDPKLKPQLAYAPWSQGYIPSSTSIEVITVYPVLCPDGILFDARCLPRVSLPGRGVTSTGMVSRTISERITLLSSLVLTHAPDQNPPVNLVLAYMTGLCRLSRVPAGSWPFPTLSLQSLSGRLDPYPAVPPRCFYPFLPGELRPHVRIHTFGSPKISLLSNFDREAFSRLQSFLYVQAPRFARPPDCSYHWDSASPGQPGRLHHAEVMLLPDTTCGIATYPNRAIGMTGLGSLQTSPAGLQPCRPLHIPYAGSCG
jgi:hypothetical protein